MSSGYICCLLLMVSSNLEKDLVGSAEVYLAVLVPHGARYPFTYMRARPVIDLTITRLQHRGIFTNDTVKVLYADSKCSSTYAPIEAFNFISDRSRRINVFLGPVCDFSLSPVGRYAAVWKTPVISPGGFSHTFLTDRKEFMTLTRVGVTFNGMAEGLSAIFRANDWQKILVLYEKGGFDNLGDNICYLWASSMVYYSKSRFKLPFTFDLFEPDIQGLGSLLRNEVGLNNAGLGCAALGAACGSSLSNKRLLLAFYVPNSGLYNF